MSSELAKTLRSFVTLQRGTTYKGNLVGQPGPVLLGLASIQPNGGFRRNSSKTYGGDSPEKITLHPGDIFVSLKDVTQSGDLLGSVARVPPDVHVGRLTQDTVKLDFNVSDVPRSYIYWLLRTPAYRNYCRARGTGTTTLGLARDDFLDFPVPIPEQSELNIVDLLEGIEGRIALLRETNATLEAIAQALFKSWFVDFDPVRAKMEGRALEGMDEVTSTLFPGELEESEIGGIPKGWHTDALGNVTSYLNRGISPKYVEEGGVVVVNQKCIREFTVDLTRARRHDPNLRKIDGRELQVGDVLVNSTGVGTLGRVAQVLDLRGTTIADSHVTVVRAKKPVTWNYLGLALMRMQAQIEAMGEGTTGQTELSRGKLALLKMLVPSGEALHAFDEVSHSLRLRFSRNLELTKTLAALRDTLLPRLISSKLRRPEAEAT